MRTGQYGIVFLLFIFVGFSSTLVFGEESEILVGISKYSSVMGCEEKKTCYVPYQITIKPGSQVIWSNHDVETHTIISGISTFHNLPGTVGPNGIFDSGLITIGNSFSVTFDDIGNHPYFCSLHPWMTGIILVKEQKNESVSKAIFWDKPVYKIGDWGKITFEISEKNINPSFADSFSIFADSNSDPDGIKILMVETARDSGIFSGSVLFSADFLSENKLFVKPGDAVYANFGNYTNTAVIESSTMQFNLTPQSEQHISDSKSHMPGKDAIPKWIRGNAIWWSEGKITDEDFISGIEYLVKEKIITVDTATKKNLKEPLIIPPWIKNISEWWGYEQVSDDDFKNAISWLIKNGVILITDFNS